MTDFNISPTSINPKTLSHKIGLVIFTMSDSSGETAEAVARACLVQFPPSSVSIYRLPQIRSSKQILTLIEEIKDKNALIVYTLVLPEFRITLEAATEKYHIQRIDLLGQLIDKLTSLTHQQPLSVPGRLHVMDETYYKRIEAVDFAIRYDDGKNPDGIKQADVVLIGVSRTSKTPNCMYLAQHYGLKAANIPLVFGIEPPLNLYQISNSKIVGLSIDPHLLQDIRSTRAQIMGLSSQADYADLDRINQEVRYAKNIFRELKCHVIDVSAKAVEEISSEIYLYLGQ